ncbi:septum formation initiator family protein [Borrelia sp. BU AG58]|uniref:septum formation initiator family protein n=1 Tax=Borrelia sp. BU AG58 TaxID=2887345 RepID=UPI001E48CEBA|nr:septum formation initiator family protein [Borrelia sp. BU AG58]UER67891.1 septum formation initiator family protein [Borrelia sp. BU AG58]
MFLVKKIVLSVYVGLVSYFIITPVFGERGVVNYRKLHNSSILMSKHITELKEIQKKLKAKYISLQVSKPAIIKEAGKIGYYPRNSVVIKNTDYDGSYSQGKILYLKNAPEDGNVNNNFYLISTLISLIFYFVLSYLETLNIFNKERWIL